jgi:hypothetical protein
VTCLSCHRFVSRSVEVRLESSGILAGILSGVSVPGTDKGVRGCFFGSSQGTNARYFWRVGDKLAPSRRSRDVRFGSISDELLNVSNVWNWSGSSQQRAPFIGF